VYCLFTLAPRRAIQCSAGDAAHPRDYLVLAEKESSMKKERRDFLKLTTAGATGLTGLMLVKPRLAHAAWPATGTTDLNPAVSNMRVVSCVDTAMMKSVPSSMTFDTQNAAVDWARVQANMDAMAMSLTQKSTPDDAWKTIFRSSKDWASTVVAIKVNAGEAKNTARLAVLQKFSNLFTGWGVQPKNFIIYAGHSPADTIFSSSFSTTDKSKVLGVVSSPTGNSGDLLGGWKDQPLPNGSPTRRCAAKIVDGTVDILIDIANNKGHPMFGKVTLCMKNHYGTFEPDANHTDLNNLIFNMNKSDAIIGGTPPRQQLCFVDSIFCNKSNVFGTPELMPCYLVMGTFAPAVDYLTVKKIREAVSNLTHDSAVIDSYVTSFGYKTSDPQWIVVPPGGATPDAGSTGSGGAGAGGKSGSADASAGGSSGAGGAGTGGSKGSVDAKAGGTGGTGGLAGGGAKGSGGVSGSVGSGGASGAPGSGGAEAGGAGGTAGHTSAGGAGGASSSSNAGAGGVASSGGTTGHVASNASTGCGCDVGGIRNSAGGLGATLVVGTLIAGQLKRLFQRRESMSENERSETTADPPNAVAPDDTSTK
jgi:Domain of unknown function (DUF362)